jgi:hypothetical protein
MTEYSIYSRVMYRAEPDGRRAWLLTSLLLAAVLLTTCATATAVELQSNRVAERPSAQYAHNSSSSYMEKSFFFSPGVSQISFDYFVDSEPSHDFLNLYIDGVQQDLDPTLSGTQGISGLNKRGRRVILVTTGATHTIRFAYLKNGSLSRGLDTAWVDNVRIYNSSASVKIVTSLFNTTDSLSAVGWTPGGMGGGFVIGKPRQDLSAGRPGAQYGANSTSSYMERTVTWPACSPSCPKWLGAAQFDYYVDSQAGHDYLNFYIDNVKQDLDPTLAGTQGISGLNKFGSIRLPVATSGSHTIKFEYLKDGSLSHGRDTAKIDLVTLYSGNGNILEQHTFSGRDINTTPIKATVAGVAGPIEWSSGGYGNGWVVNRATPAPFYVPKQTVGSALFAHYETFLEPLMDGVFKDSKEYRNPTRTDLFNVANPGAEMGKLGLVNSNGTLVIGLRAKARTTAQGNEFGNVYLYFDAGRDATLRDTGGGCAGGLQYAAADDRLIRFSYSIASGGTTANVSHVEEKGTCLGTWASLSGATAWLTDPAAQIKVSEPTSDVGFVHFEIKVPLPTAVQNDRAVGFGLKRVSNLFTPSEEWFPSDDSGGPAADDVYTWATLYIGSMPSQVKSYQSSENVFRLTGHPLPDRPKAFFIK